MMLRFLEPNYGFLLLPLILGLVWSWRHVHGMAKTRKRLAFAIRFLVLTLVVFALMGPQLRRPDQGVATIFILDRSDSVAPADRKKAEDFIRTAIASLGPDDLGGVIGMGAHAVLESVPGPRRTMGPFQAEIDPSATNIAESVRLASAIMPEGKDKRVVILSDGNETAGDLRQAADVARTEKITLDTFPLGTEKSRAEAAIVDLECPSERRADETFDIRVVTESTVAQSASIVLDRDGEIVDRQQVSLKEGKSAFLFTQKLDHSGFFRYRATLVPSRDSDTRNNVGAGFVSVKGKPKVLLLQTSVKERELYDALIKQGIDVKLSGPGGFPVRAEEFQAYEGVILNDFNARYTTPGQMEMLKTAVKETGIGLAMIGGEDSFLPGGWYGTAVAEALPVDLNIRQRKSFPNTSVLIVLDTSGSMSMLEDGEVKLNLAMNAAIQTAKLMGQNDRLGVAGSGTYIEMVAPMQQLSNREAVFDQIRHLGPGGGGIYIGPSVRFAEQTLRNENSKVKHFILMADGDDSEDPQDAYAVVSRMKDAKITTSVVAIGNGKDVQLLQALAALGGGRYYLADHANKLPAILTQDVAIMSRSAIEEGVFIPKLFGGDEVLSGIDSVPPLSAYCLADGRPLARVSMKSPKGDPILASWQFGLGQTLAFTSDAQSRWATEWVKWDGFPKFWAQAVRSISRKPTVNNYQVEVRPEAGMAQIKISATDRIGNPLSASNLRVSVSSPGGKVTHLLLNQTAPGAFAANIPSQDLGTYLVSVEEQAKNGGVGVATAGFGIPYPPEYRLSRTNRPLLARVSELTHGKLVSKPSEILRPTLLKGESLRDLWPIFLLIAGLLLPLDVAVRRVILPWDQLLKWTAATEPLSRLERGKTTEAATGPRVPGQPKPKPGQAKQVPPTTGSAGGRLLESRRRRGTDDDEK